MNELIYYFYDTTPSHRFAKELQMDQIKVHSNGRDHLHVMIIVGPQVYDSESLTVLTSLENICHATHRQSDVLDADLSQVREACEQIP